MGMARNSTDICAAKQYQAFFFFDRTYHVDMEAGATFPPLCNLPNISHTDRNHHLIFKKFKTQKLSKITIHYRYYVALYVLAL